MIEPPPPSFHLTDKVAILTGASSGLGRRFAKVLGSSGARVVAAARRAEPLAELAAEATEGADGKPNFHPVQCDVTDPATARLLVDTAANVYGAVDIVVNNAGISRVLAAVDDSRDGFVGELAVNLVAPYEISRAAARWMIDHDRGGSIINIGSVMGMVGGGRMKAPGYAASKGGLHNLTRELASEWARKGIRVNALAPAWFESEMTEPIFGSDAGRHYIETNTPMGRAGRVGELDGPLLFLASDASSYLTGQVLAVDGGWTAI
jgi:NAD(P)-dependent dehydrogenase (short-subunit alcohol dehydrogenase family)